MSPGHTMLRVYAALKARILAGEFAPGERLDPARLAPDLGTSRTPVRDALLRLSGERLLESWQDEGFRQPQLSEAAMRDLYHWSNEVLHLALRTTERHPSRRDAPVDRPGDAYVAVVTACFQQVAALSANHEHRAAVASINDRAALLRIGEWRALDDASQDVVAITVALDAGAWAEAGRAIDHFHRRRLRAVADIAAVLRPRTPPAP